MLNLHLATIPDEKYRTRLTKLYRTRYIGGMDTTIPTAQEVRDKLATLNRSDVQALAQRSGVPFHTLLKIKSGETENPGLETVRLFWPELSTTKRKKGVVHE